MNTAARPAAGAGIGAWRIGLLLLGAAAAGCGGLPLYTTLPVEQRPSPNFSERRPNFVILHHTTNDSAERALATLTNPARRVSAHYLVGRDGRIYYLVDELARAWHAGESYWGGNRDLNSASIGIELDNNGAEPYPEPQIEALFALLADLRARYRIPADNFLGHGEVSPGRKTDPNELFPWQRLAQAGFGLWCEPPYPAPAPGADGILLLAAFGYDVSNPAAAIGAFRRRYAPGALAGPAELSTDEIALLQCLLAQKHGG
jgi:N-acetylmuramoyl-L-alanine amidase